VKSRLLPLVLVPLFTLFSTVALGQSSASPGRATAHPDLVLQVGHAKPITALVFSPDGKWLASASDDLTIKIWDLATGSVVRTIQSGTRIATLAISPDAKLLAAGHGVDLLSSVSLLSRHQGDQYAIDLWDVATGRMLRTLSSHAFTVQGMAFSRDGHELTSVSGDAIKKWAVDTGSAKTT
jgi:WD40 repeat protein